MSDFPESTQPPDSLDVLVIGAGFAGLYALHRMRELGFNVHVLEAAEDIGGVWWANRYPGARCDVESINYCYSFDDSLVQDWTWTERYPAQPEILSYLMFAADRLDLRRDISLATKVTSLHFDEVTSRWHATTVHGDVITAEHVMMATGQLSEPLAPTITGSADFAGDSVLTARWPASGVDLEGKRVGVIGTGSSGTQVIPQLAKLAGELFVFQRTPHYIVPAMNHQLEPQDVAEDKANFSERREAARRSYAGMDLKVGEKSVFEVTDEEFAATMEECWHAGGPHISAAYRDVRNDADAAEKVGEFVRSKIREIVRDPVVAETLCPKGYPYGTKRLVLEIDYYETYNRPNVRLVSLLTEPIERITPEGIRTAKAEYPLDVIVYATGFDALTGALHAIDIRGIGGLTLKEKFSAGPRSHLGITTAGFPNMYFIAQAGSPSVLSNLVVSIEQHIEWISDLISYMRDTDLHHADVTEVDEQAWVDEVNRLANLSLFPAGKSWYLGDNVEGKPRAFLVYFGGVARYADICDEVAAEGYRGFVLT